MNKQLKEKSSDIFFCYYLLSHRQTDAQTHSHTHTNPHTQTILINCKTITTNNAQGSIFKLQD